MQQAVDQGAGPMARRRMHDETGRFVDDQQLSILVHHGKGHRFRPPWRDRRVLGVHGNGLAAADLVSGFTWLAIDQHPPCFDPGGESTARIAVAPFGKALIKALTDGLGGKGDV